MLLSNATYGEIVDFLGQNGVGISVASVCRYAQAYQANVQWRWPRRISGA